MVWGKATPEKLAKLELDARRKLAATSRAERGAQRQARDRLSARQADRAAADEAVKNQ